MAYISFQPSDNYNTKLYTGTAGAGQSYTGLGFAPDRVWSKSRTAANNSGVYDSVRGVEKLLYGNEPNAQTTTTDCLATFGSDGITFGANGTIGDSSDFVNWCWKMGTTTGIAGSPSITPSSYSFNATAGQSIIAYTGTGVNATLPHGLGVAPECIIVKKLSDSDNWNVGHQNMKTSSPWDWAAKLNTTAAPADDNTIWNDTAPTSTLFSIGTSTEVNNSTSTYIAYCFAPVKGYSKFGSYQGNGNANGSFTYTGFRPGFLMIKRTNTGGQWMIFDDKRLGYNERNYDFQASNSNAERTTGPWMDILSNGFKIRSTDTDFNGGGDSMFYAAFAAYPTVSSNNLPGVAR